LSDKLKIKIKNVGEEAQMRKKKDYYYY